MPTFDFRCTACETIFEFSRPFGSTVTPTCVKCGSEKTEKLIAPPAIQFKGSGFYKNDSKIVPKGKETQTKDAKKQESPEKKSDASSSNTNQSDTKTEQKPSTPVPSKKPV